MTILDKKIPGPTGPLLGLHVTRRYCNYVLDLGGHLRCYDSEQKILCWRCVNVVLLVLTGVARYYFGVSWILSFFSLLEISRRKNWGYRKCCVMGC